MRLPPAAADPNVAVAVSPPMAADPDGARPGARHIAATNPYPAAVPGPITRRPNIIWTRRDRNVLNLRRRRGRGSLDCRLWRRGRLRRHSNWSRLSLLPIGRRGRRGNSCHAVGRRWRWIDWLAGVSRLNVIHRHIFHPPLHAAGCHDPNTREREARVTEGMRSVGGNTRRSAAEGRAV